MMCLILNSRYTKVVTMIVFGIKKIRLYSLFYCINSLKMATCWVKLHVYLKADIGSSFGSLFFPLHLFICASVKQKMQFYCPL